MWSAGLKKYWPGTVMSYYRNRKVKRKIALTFFCLFQEGR
jgi:hypothetical protein